MFNTNKRFLELTVKNWNINDLLNVLFTRKENKLSDIINEENILEGNEDEII